jgi:hypothetical protein
MVLKGELAGGGARRTEGRTWTLASVTPMWRRGKVSSGGNTFEELLRYSTAREPCAWHGSDSQVGERSSART